MAGLEWRAMENGKSAPEAEAALDDLTTFAVRTSSDPRVEYALIDALMRLRAAREQRLAIAAGFSDERKWTAVFLMAFLTQIGLAATHLERARAQLMAQAIFASAAFTSLALVAEFELPFQPPNATSVQPLVELLPQG